MKKLTNPLPERFHNNMLAHLFQAFMGLEVKPLPKKVKHEGPTSSWPCKIEGCRQSRHIENDGKVRPYCSEHQREYNREKAKVNRLLGKKRVRVKKNALPK